MKKKLNKKIIIGIVCMILAPAILAGIVLVMLPRNAYEVEERTGEISTDTTAVTQDTETERRSDIQDTDTQRQPIQVIELDAGNEIYLDADVIDKLTVLEADGNEDLVNAILDGEIKLINAFADRGYSLKAIRQIQRFYFMFYDALKDIEYEAVMTKIAEFVTAEGMCEESAVSDVQGAFGLDLTEDCAYILYLENSE